MKVETFILSAMRDFANWKRTNHFLNNNNDINEIESIVINKALIYAKSKRTIYSMKRKTLFLNILDVYRWKSTLERRKFNFPNAFLFTGLSEIAKVKKDEKLIIKTATSFNSFINNDGTPKFVFNKVDQVPFALAAMNLYQCLGDKKYKKMADYVYQKLNTWVDPVSKLIQYRKDSKVMLNDLVGMVCPFLVRYGTLFRIEQSIELAYKQIEYFILYGIEKDSHLPVHGIINNLKIKVGPTNWGRGIGWYIIALSFYSSLVDTKCDNLIRTELKELVKTLNLIKNKDSLWSQFPGSSERFDASSSLMIMFGINNVFSNSYTKKDILLLLRKYIDRKGAITATSGETFGINAYSNVFSKSEFSQGMLLMLLSTTYQ